MRLSPVHHRWAFFLFQALIDPQPRTPRQADRSAILLLLQGVLSARDSDA